MNHQFLVAINCFEQIMMDKANATGCHCLPDCKDVKFSFNVQEAPTDLRRHCKGFRLVIRRMPALFKRSTESLAENSRFLLKYKRKVLFPDFAYNYLSLAKVRSSLELILLNHKVNWPCSSPLLASPTSSNCSIQARLFEGTRTKSLNITIGVPHTFCKTVPRESRITIVYWLTVFTYQWQNLSVRGHPIYDGTLAFNEALCRLETTKATALVTVLVG